VVPAPAGRPANSPAGTRAAASGATNPTRRAFIAAAFAYEISFESPTRRNVRGPAICFSAVIAPVTWATSPAPPSQAWWNTGIPPSPLTASPAWICLRSGRRRSLGCPHRGAG
jgi:hypothetical protein